MAVWQADFLLIPKLEFSISNNDRRDFSWWASTELHSLAGLELRKLLPSTNSWDKEIECFGFEEMDRIEIWKNDGRLSDIRIRIDLREPHAKLIHSLLQICSEFGLCFIDEKNETIQPTFGDFKKSLMESNAYHFCKDPIKFLENLTKYGG